MTLPLGTEAIARLFLAPATSALLGPFVGKLVDGRGRKFGSLLYSLFYSPAR